MRARNFELRRHAPGTQYRCHEVRLQRLPGGSRKNVSVASAADKLKIATGPT
jgi:hypothetical protein